MFDRVVPFDLRMAGSDLIGCLIDRFSGLKDRDLIVIKYPTNGSFGVYVVPPLQEGSYFIGHEVDQDSGELGNKCKIHVTDVVASTFNIV